MNTAKQKMLHLLLASCLCAPISAQVLNLNTGQLTYKFNASSLGDMLLGADKTITLQGKTFPTSAVSSITIDDIDDISDNVVAVTFDDMQEAKVEISGNIANEIAVDVKGNNVNVVCNEAIEDNVAFVLSGSTSNGSFSMVGSAPSQLVLDGVNITNPNGATITIDDGKLLTLTVEGKDNQLRDGNGEQSACFYCDGHVKVEGDGNLTVYGTSSHAFSTDEYLHFTQDFTGTFRIIGAEKDGLHVKQYLRMDSGTLKVENAKGDAVDVSAKNSQRDYNGQIIIDGGCMDLTTIGDAAKALKADSAITITNGTITATTTGDAYYDAEQKDISSSSAVKTGSTFTMSGGAMTAISTGSGAKGINADSDITIDGGTLTVATTGNVFEYGDDDSKPHGIKSDKNIRINGGRVLSCASADDGTPFKVDGKGGFAFEINGGTLMGIGASYGRPTGGSQNYETANKQDVKGGKEFACNGVTFTIPSVYSNDEAKVIVSDK